MNDQNSHDGQQPQPPIPAAHPAQTAPGSVPPPPPGAQPYAAPAGGPHSGMQGQPPRKTGPSAGCAVTIAVIIGLIATVFQLGACVATLSTAAYEPSFDLPALEDASPKFDSKATYNAQLRSRLGLDGPDPNAAITVDELASVDEKLGGAHRTGASYSRGVWIVGENIEPGTYWLDGKSGSLSRFYALETTDTTDAESERAYQTTNLNAYYGHNIFILKEGQALILEDEEMIPISQMNATFNAPYGSGVYRVGTDIPAGTYRLSPGNLDDYYGCFVMDDLDYQDSSYDDQTLTTYDPEAVQEAAITLEDGQYVEFYNVSASPGTAGPRAHAFA